MLRNESAMTTRPARMDVELSANGGQRTIDAGLVASTDELMW
jgi:hypothetical protein